MCELTNYTKEKRNIESSGFVEFKCLNLCAINQFIVFFFFISIFEYIGPTLNGALNVRGEKLSLDTFPFVSVRLKNELLRVCINQFVFFLSFLPFTAKSKVRFNRYGFFGLSTCLRMHRAGIVSLFGHFFPSRLLLSTVLIVANFFFLVCRHA